MLLFLCPKRACHLLNHQLESFKLKHSLGIRVGAANNENLLKESIKRLQQLLIVFLFRKVLAVSNEIQALVLQSVIQLYLTTALLGSLVF